MSGDGLSSLSVPGAAGADGYGAVLRCLCGRMDYGTGGAFECVSGIYPAAGTDKGKELYRDSAGFRQDAGKYDGVLDALGKK